jgi:hypothetical protein
LHPDERVGDVHDAGEGSAGRSVSDGDVVDDVAVVVGGGAAQLVIVAVAVVFVDQRFFTHLG